jgi:hypothetical protein
MAGQYGDMQDFAVEMCEEFGTETPVTFNHYEPTTYADGEVVLGNPKKVFTVPAVILPASSGHRGSDNRLLAGTLAGKKIRYLLVPARDATFEPVATDRVIMDGAAWEVSGCTPLNPALDEPVTYEVLVFKL